MSAKLRVVQAFDQALIAEVPTDNANALEAKLVAAQRAFLDRGGWLKTYQRMDILRRLAASMNARKEHFARLIAQEGGKPLTDAQIEVTRAIDGILDAAAELRTFAGREIPMGLTPASADRLAVTFKEPIGIVAAISAFNHPLNLIVHQIIPAIAVGCPVIVKPASATPLSCLDFVAMVHEAGLPEAWCQTFIAENRSLSEALATDTRIGFLSFIGSARVGWDLHAKLAAGTRSALEHGGAAPAIIDESANLDAAVSALAKGGYYHAGQVCVSTQRIFVHDDIKCEFLGRFVAKVGALQVGDPLLPETEVGPLILPKEADRVMSWIGEAVASGASLATGGARLSSAVISPAILVEPGLNTKVSNEELFGPGTCVYGYSDLDDAIAVANSLPVAFQASIFTRDLATALRAAERLDASAVMINDHSAFRTDWMPFAGRKQSGYGVGGIPWSMREMTQEKMVVFRT